MRMMIGGRKAVLFTLSLFLITLAVFSFAKLVFEESEQEKITFQTMTAANRLHDMDSSLQRVVRQTFEAHSGMSMEMEERDGSWDISFAETLPNNITIFRDRMADLSNFTREIEPRAVIETNTTPHGTPLIIMPFNVSYEHNASMHDADRTGEEEDEGSVARKVMLRWPDSAVEGYSSMVTIPVNATCTWDYQSGSFPYSLEVDSPEDTGCDRERSIDPSAGALITITSEENPSDTVAIRIKDGASNISLSGSGNFSSELDTTISLNSSLLQDAPQPEIWLGSRLIRTNLTAFGFRRSGGVRMR
ncbi:MAG: hypothetical protein R6U32_02805 [Candidatus Woesearchaeota archaeon]